MAGTDAGNDGGGPDELRFDPADYDFGPLPAGQTSNSRLFQIHNAGLDPTGTLAVTIDPPEDFSVASNSCIASLTPGTSCSVQVVFVPQGVGVTRARLTVSSEAGQTGKVELTGRGTSVALVALGVHSSRELELIPSFSSKTLVYAAQGSPLTRAVRIQPTAADDQAAITVNGQAVSSGVLSERIELTSDPTSVSVVVRATGGDSRTYSLPVDRDGEPVQQTYFKPAMGSEGLHFGSQMAVNGDLLAVGAASEAAGGVVYVFRRNGSSWAQEAILRGSNTESGDRFGSSLALDGDTLVIGAVLEDSAVDATPTDNSAEDSGAAYVFRRNGTGWKQEAMLKASNAEAGDFFGICVAIDDELIVIGAREEDSVPGYGPTNNGSDGSGAAYVFRRSSDIWSQEAMLKPFSGDSMDLFGWAVAIDGDWIVVGAPYEDASAGAPAEDNSATDSGAVYLFRHDGTNWFIGNRLKASNAGAGDWFGTDVAIQAGEVVVGASREDSSTDTKPDDNSVENSGAVYVFRHTQVGWRQEALLKASNPGPWDRFADLALKGDVLAVGAAGEDSAAGALPSDDSAPSSGAVYVFRKVGTAWTERAMIKASNAEANDIFGTEVKIDGDQLVVGASGEASAATGIDGDQDDNSAESAGAAYLFH